MAGEKERQGVLPVLAATGSNGDRRMRTAFAGASSRVDDYPKQVPGGFIE
jgi:hypothetical protein